MVFVACNKRYEFSENMRNPLESFKLLIDDEMIDMVVTNTIE